MLTRWLTFTAFLAGSASPQSAVSVAPTCRVKGHPQAQLTFNCGDGKNAGAGVLLYWHTPFGELQSQSFQSELDPVFVHRDGSLVIPSSSALHSGLYYCLLQHTGGTTLWPYELHVDQNRQKSPDRDGHEQSSSCATVRVSGGVGPGGQKLAGAGVSQEEFAGAVAASVLLTFVLGFSTGALSRTHVLRCLRAVTKRLQSPRQQTDTVDCEITTATVPPVSQDFEMGQVQDDDSVNCASVDTTTSSSASSPPAKPQRGFRQKREEQQETAAYDYKKEEEAGREAGGSQDEMDDEKWREDREGKGGEVSREEEEERRQEEEAEADVQEEGELNKGSEEAAGGDEEKRRGDEKREEEGCNEEKERGDGDEARREEDSQQSSTETEDEETGSKTQEGGESAASCLSRPARRVIRLYQYDEDGQRYGHLPDPAPNDAGPAPRPRQRTVSLTRLNAIMAAATAGPLDTRETRREEEEEKSQFQMDI